MAICSKKVILHSNVETVWKTVISVENYTWRSDLDRAEWVSEGVFVEYTKEGYATNFTITKEEPCRCWEFDMENENMRGHWTGRFTPNGDDTEIELIEDVTAKKFFLRPFVKGYLKKQQERFVADLTKALQQQKKMPSA